MREFIKNWLKERMWVLVLALVVWFGVSWLWTRKDLKRINEKAQKHVQSQTPRATNEELKTKWNDETVRIDRIPDDSLQSEIDRIYNKPK
jgi:hypothetical protein